MKNLSNLLLLCFILVVIGCEQKNNPQLVSLTKKSSDISLYAVPYDTFKIDSARFAAVSDTIFSKVPGFQNDTEPIKAFTIRAADLLEAIGLPADIKCTQSLKYDYARIYLGLNNLGELKLYLTPVDSANLTAGYAGKDVILDGPFKGNPKNNVDGSEQPSDGQYLMDFTSPCPKTCPE